LRNGENGAAGLGNAEIHFAVGVFENAEANNFVDHVIKVLVGIGVSDGEEDE
jgi:hypothetical protein